MGETDHEEAPASADERLLSNRTADATTACEKRPPQEADVGATAPTPAIFLTDRALTMRGLLHRHWAPLLLMWLAHACIGATNALPGSCLLMLASRVGATLSVMGLWYTVKSATACLLAVLTGCLFPRLGGSSWRQLTFLLGANLVCALAVLAVPLARSLWTALGLAGLLGAGHSALETADGILAILLFGSQHSRPILQSLHFSVALGALAAPALLHPFQAQLPGERGDSDGGGANFSQGNSTLSHDHLRMCLPLPSNVTDAAATGHRLPAEQPPPAVLHPPLLGPFAVVDAAQIIAAVGFLVLLAQRHRLLAFRDLLAVADSEKATMTTSQPEPQELLMPPKLKEAWRRRLLVGLTVAFYFCFVGVENVFWSFIGAYGVCSPMRLRALNAAFFAGFLCGRGLGVAAAHWARPAAILLADLAGCQVALALLCLAGASPWLTVAATAGFGLSVSTMYASGISWLEERLDVAGPLACSWTIGSQLGVSVLPALAGHLLLSPLGPVGVLYLALAGFTGASACFLGMLAVGHLRC